MRLPEGVNPVTSEATHDLERLANEVQIIKAPECCQYQWGRERFFYRRSDAQSSGRLLVAYSVNSAGRIIRGWYLNKFDQCADSVYKIAGSCPAEAAWLATLTLGQPSEPAWLYLRPTSAIAP